MACGRAVIVANAGGAMELFKHRKDAIGFTPGSDQELAKAIVELARDETLRQELGRAARATALERFSDQRVGRELEECYRRALM
jgi:glycosyltransferase involved in cell wall biosynthesis